MQVPPGAELVPNAGGDELPTVPIDELDFDFVAKCTDTQRLRDILAILESGKEGHYPELIQATIDRLLDQLPPKEKKLFISLRSKPSAQEEDEAKTGISEWINEISKRDAAVAATASSTAGTGASASAQRQSAATPLSSTSGDIFVDELGAGRGGDDDLTTSEIAGAYASRVPVRNQRNAADAGDSGPRRQQLGSSTASINSDQQEPPRWTEAKPDPKARDFKSYYDDWDKFDPEQELEKMTEEEKAEEQVRQQRRKAQAERLQAQADARRERMRELGISLDPSTMTPEERAFTADYEKRKGNECFKANEFEDAVMFYSRSIFVKPDNHVVWANRAMAHLRLKQFDQAEDDCTEAIRLDPTYIKAISRRAMTRHKRGKYREAAQDYHAAVKMDPSNKTLQTLLQESRRKFTEVEGLGLDAEQNPVQPEKFKRISIAVDDSSDDDDDDSDDDDAPTLSGVMAPPKKSAAPQQFTKVQVQAGSDSSSEDDDSDDEDAPSEPAVNEASAQQAASDRIIQETLVEATDDAASAVEKIRARGNAFFAAGDVDLAIATYDQAVSLRPLPPPASLAACFANRAAAHLKKNSHSFAEKDASAALDNLAAAMKSAPNATADQQAKWSVLRLKVLYRRAVARKAQGKLASAITDLQTVLALQPQNSQAQALLQNAQAEKAHREESAGAEARRAAEVARQQARDAKVRKQEQQKAEREAAAQQRAKQAEVDTPMAHRQMLERLGSAAPALPQEGSAATAAAAASATTSCATTSSGVGDAAARAQQLKNEGNQAFSSKKYDSAIALYSQAIDLDPQNHVYYLNRAAALLAITTEKSWLRCVDDASQAAELAATQLALNQGDSKLKSARIKAIFRRASAREKLVELAISRNDKTAARGYARAALADVLLALESEPGHQHMVKMKTRLETKLKGLEISDGVPAGDSDGASGTSRPSPGSLSKKAAGEREKAEKAAALAEKARQARRQSAESSPAKQGFKAPKTAYAVKQALASMRHGSDASVRQAEYLWQFKTGSWTSKKLFAGGVDVEILGPLLRSLDLHFPVSPKRCISILQKIASCKNAGTAAMLLENEDSEILKRLVAAANKADPTNRLKF